MSTQYRRLAAADIPATSTLTDVYTVPVPTVGFSTKRVHCDINIINRSDTDTLIRYALIKNGTSSSVSDIDYRLHDLPTSALASNLTPISDSSLLMETGDTIAVYSTASELTVQVVGIEEDVK